MITILWTIVTSILKLRCYSDYYCPRINLRDRSCCKESKGLLVCKVIVAIGLGLLYGTWIIVSILNSHLFDPGEIVSFLVAQEAAVSGSLAALLAMVNKVSTPKPSDPGDQDAKEDSDSNQTDAE
jgi:hypothetical protein